MNLLILITLIVPVTLIFLGIKLLEWAIFGDKKNIEEIIKWITQRKVRFQHLSISNDKNVDQHDLNVSE